MRVDPEAGVVTYVDVWPGVDVRYTVTGSGFKEDVVINRPGQVPSFEFEVTGSPMVEDPELGWVSEAQKGRPAEMGAPVQGGLALGRLVVEDATGRPVDNAAAAPWMTDASVGHPKATE